MTKVVTSIVVVALLLLGGPALRGFSEALLIGIIAGTYSSIYISSAIALDCGLKAEHVFPTVRKDPIDATALTGAVSEAMHRAAHRSARLDSVRHAVAARDRSRHRQHHLHLDPGRAGCRRSGASRRASPAWRSRC